MWVNAKVLIYRKDLIPEEKVPANWEEYQALAEELTTDDMYGTTVFGSGSDGVCSFLDFSCQAGAEGLVFDKDGKVNITDQAYVDALGADKVGCAPMIAGSAGIGATTGPWYECVMKNSSNQEMAMKYVEYMYDHNADYMDLTLKIAGRTSVYEEAGNEAGNEHTTAVLETLGAAQKRYLYLEGAKSFRLEFWIDAEKLASRYLEIGVLGKGEEATVVSVDLLGKMVSLDKSRGDAYGRGRMNCPVEIQNGRCKLLILVDHSTAEVYVDEGRYCITSNVYPRMEQTECWIRTPYKKGVIEKIRISCLEKFWE